MLPLLCGHFVNINHHVYCDIVYTYKHEYKKRKHWIRMRYCDYRKIFKFVENWFQRKFPFTTLSAAEVGMHKLHWNWIFNWFRFHCFTHNNHLSISNQPVLLYNKLYCNSIYCDKKWAFCNQFNCKTLAEQSFFFIYYRDTVNKCIECRFDAHSLQVDVWLINFVEFFSIRTFSFSFMLASEFLFLLSVGLVLPTLYNWEPSESDYIDFFLYGFMDTTSTI